MNVYSYVENITHDQQSIAKENTDNEVSVDVDGRA